VHIYERYAWMVITLVMLILWGLGAHAGFDVNAGRAEEPTGMNLAANVLSFGGIVFGFFTGVRPSSYFFFPFWVLKMCHSGHQSPLITTAVSQSTPPRSKYSSSRSSDYGSPFASFRSWAPL